MDLKKKAVDIFLKSVKAADPYECVKKHIKVENETVFIDNHTYPLSKYKKIVIVGGGKASARMAQAAEDILGDLIYEGWINTKDGHSYPLKKIKVQECSHPVPDSRGVEGARKIAELLDNADENTLVICLLSGGGSALMPAPAEGITLKEKQDVTKLLLSSGADIYELNAIRKHMSMLKGGGMARLCNPAILHVLILSDVIGDRLDTIASGPAVSDSSTFSECLEICHRHGIIESLPKSVLQRFLNGSKGLIPETAKPGDYYLKNAVNTLIGNNGISVEAARSEAEKIGFRTLVLSTVLQGEASELGNFFSAIASEIKASGNPIPMPACIIGGGETTVTVHGRGKGGRNMEMALSVAAGISGFRDVVFLSGGTDGTDGPTDAAGGIVDGATVKKGRLKGFSFDEFLMDNDSYNYLKETDGLIITGPTGTNVMDIQILLVGIPS